MTSIINRAPKLLLALGAAQIMAAANATAATIEFNPTEPLAVVNSGGFFGTTTLPSGYSQARIRFTFSDLTLPTSFTISNIFLAGDGITSSLSLGSVNITNNGATATAFGLLSTSITSLNFANSLISFDLPANAVNNGASFTVAVQYADAIDDQRNTSSGGNIYASVIPEPTTALMGSIGMLLLLRRRR